MRIYLDNNFPYRFRNVLGPKHQVKHAKDMGWQGFKNGDLVKAVSEQFDAMITIDKNMSYQTLISGLRLPVMVLDCLSNRLDDLLPFVPKILEEIHSLKPGEYRLIHLD